MTNGKLGLALVVLALPINARTEEGRTAAQLMQWCSEVGQKGVTASDPYVNGMPVTVEINTGSRRLISYLVSPLVKYGHESLRER
jgi:hypothetical protein